MIFKRLGLLFVLLILVSCTHYQKPLVYTCAEIKLPPDPVPVTRTLTKGSTPDQVIKAWVATAYQYRAWNRAVRAQVETSK